MSCAHSSFIPLHHKCSFNTKPAANTVCFPNVMHSSLIHSINHKCPFNTLPNNTGATYAAACFSRVTRSSLIHSITSQMLLNTKPAANTVCFSNVMHLSLIHSITSQMPLQHFAEHTGATYAAACFSRVTRSSLKRGYRDSSGTSTSSTHTNPI